MNITVAFADAHGAQMELLELPPGSLLADALAAAALATRLAREHGTLTAGIWNHVRALDTLLADGDRVELYKPLIADPKVARRLRAERSREEVQKKRAAARKVTQGTR
ncbi:MAG: RnfH family protein [Burkholderiaceae bacterium]